MYTSRYENARNSVTNPISEKGLAIIVILSIALLAGCIPVTATYYKPHSDIGKVQNYACAGSGGVPNDLRIKRGGVTIDINADSYPRREDVVGIDFMVPRNKSLHINLKEFRLLDKNRQNMRSSINARTLTVKYKNASKKLDLSQTTLRGDSYASAARGYSSWYKYLFQLDYGALQETFYMELPVMEVGDRRYPAFLVKFERTRGTFLTPVNGC